MKNILREIKFAYQRVVRGYDDSIEWGFDTYFMYITVPALKEFCEKQLEDTELMELNPKSNKIYVKTLKLIHEAEECYLDEEAVIKLATYFGQNIIAYSD